MDMNRPHLLGVGDALERRHSDTSILQTTQMVFGDPYVVYGE
jgi:hypothetical protein